VKKEAPDLRSFLEQVRHTEPEQILEISQEVPLDYTATALALELDKQNQTPILFFDKIKDHDFRLVANICASRDRLSKSINTDTNNFYKKFAKSLRNLIEAEIIDSGPVQEIVLQGDKIDLAKLPIPRHFSQDARAYITSGMLAAQDPDTGVRNLSYIRLQTKGPNRMGASLHSRQHQWDYMRRAEIKGQDLEVAVVIGAHPAVMLAGAAKMGIDEDEYDLAGALLNQSIPICKGKTVDVYVPANAEIVIEGKLLADIHEPEGPFGEYTGYVTGRSTENVLEVTAITMRKDAIFVDIIPGNSTEHLILGRIAKEAWVHERMKEALPFYLDFHYPSSGTHYHCYVRIDRSSEGQAKQAAQLLVALDHYVKFVVVVDKDIDPSDQDAVLWAMATRMQADKDVDIIKNSMCNHLDPSSDKGVGAKLLVDATMPSNFTAEKVKISDDMHELVKKLLEDIE